MGKKMKASKKFRTMGEKLAHERKVRKSLTAVLATMILVGVISVPVAVNKVRKMMDDSRKVILVRDAFWAGQDDYLAWLLANGMMPNGEPEEDTVDSTLKDKEGRTSGNFGPQVQVSYASGANASWGYKDNQSEVTKGTAINYDNSEADTESAREESKKDEEIHTSNPSREHSLKYNSEMECFRITYKDVEHVYVDGVEVTFKIKDGDLYLNERYEGNHKITVVWSDGKLSISFSMEKKEEEVIIASDDGGEESSDTSNVSTDEGSKDEKVDPVVETKEEEKKEPPVADETIGGNGEDMPDNGGV